MVPYQGVWRRDSVAGPPWVNIQSTLPSPYDDDTEWTPVCAAGLHEEFQLLVLVDFTDNCRILKWDGASWSLWYDIDTDSNLRGKDLGSSPIILGMKIWCEDEVVFTLADEDYKSEDSFVIAWDGASFSIIMDYSDGPYSGIGLPDAKHAFVPILIDGAGRDDFWVWDVGPQTLGDNPVVFHHWNGSAWSSYDAPDPPGTPGVQYVTPSYGSNRWAFEDRVFAIESRYEYPNGSSGGWVNRIYVLENDGGWDWTLLYYDFDEGGAEEDGTLIEDFHVFDPGEVGDPACDIFLVGRAFWEPE